GALVTSGSRGFCCLLWLDCFDELLGRHANGSAHADSTGGGASAPASSSANSAATDDSRFWCGGGTDGRDAALPLPDIGGGGATPFILAAPGRELSALA